MPFGSEPREPGIGLALSGGGFRAVLFHCGALIRLNEFGVLSKLIRVSSVSGGAIVAGVLATRWKDLTLQGGSERFSNLQEVVIDPLLEFTGSTVDVGVILGGAINPLRTAGEQLIRAYEKRLGLGVTLKSLPERGPRFVFNSTNYATGVSFRFSKPYCGDYTIGLIEDHEFTVAQAVGCSSAFPPVLSPIVLKPKAETFTRTNGSFLFDEEDFKTQLLLADGGIYDNLGLETLWTRYETVLVSDGGKPFDTDPQTGLFFTDQLSRVREIGLNQALALRKRMLIDQYGKPPSAGAYWGIGTNIANYELPDAMPANAETCSNLARIRTRLNRFSEQEQGELINWGYVVCDAAMRRHVPHLTTGGRSPEIPCPAYSIN